MKVIFALLCLVASSLAINCAVAGDGFYCNADKSYTWCAGGGAYRMNCALGTSCNCGTDVACATPCSSACEQGVLTDAQVFCQSRINSFGNQGYICDASGAGFYQCVRDAYCPQNASPRSAYITCPLGASCLCGDDTQECSSALSQSPCIGNATIAPVTECTGHKWDCYTLTSDDAVFCAEGSTSCNRDDFDDYNVCFWNAETNSGICAEDFSCSAQDCTHESDCASGQACIINSCCGASGKCTYKCT